MKSLIIAFSTYSRFPMPRVDWNERSMRYSMCFFPLIGAVIGALDFGLYYLLSVILGMGNVFTAAAITVCPVIVTGGIHMDGFLDTIDAKSSYQSIEQKLKILKDPHTGAFAIIYCAVYFLLYFGGVNCLLEGSYGDGTSGIGKLFIILAISHIYVRALSGFSVVTFKKAKKDGMLAEASCNSNKYVSWIMLLWIMACIICMLEADIIYGGVAALIGIIVFIYYRLMSYKCFGGITGDLAGFFLQTAKLCILLGIVLAGRVVMLWF